MARKEHTYKVQQGDKVLARNIGATVTLVDYTTVQEAINAGHYENEEALVAAANEQRHIRANRAVRKVLAKEDGTVAQAIEAGNAVKVGAPRPASTPKTAKPETIRKNTAAASGNRLFQRCAQDEDFLKRMVKQGIVDQGEFAAWQATQAAPATEQATA